VSIDFSLKLISETCPETRMMADTTMSDHIVALHRWAASVLSDNTITTEKLPV
jgi:hypothetical protein